MSGRKPTTQLPLLLSGLPDSAAGWLQTAGIPVAPFRMNASLSRLGRTSPLQILLFDSRNVSGRFDADAVRECGVKTIDVADLLRDFSQHAGDEDALRRVGPSQGRRRLHRLSG